MKYTVQVYRSDGQLQIETDRSSMLQVIEEITYGLSTLERGDDFCVAFNVELFAETQEELAEMQKKWA